MGPSFHPRSSSFAPTTIYTFSYDETALQEFARLWILIVQLHVPGLTFVQGYGEGSSYQSAFETAKKQLEITSDQYSPRLPNANPFMVRQPRTGYFAVENFNLNGKNLNEVRDETTKRKNSPAIHKSDHLTNKFLAHNVCAHKEIFYLWPKNLTPEEAEIYGSEADKNNIFPFMGDDRDIAIIHADGNNLGERLYKLKEATENYKKDKNGKSQDQYFLECYKNFSKHLEDATRKAVQKATHEVLLANSEKDENKENYFKVPGRPLVLGGDDLTILVRADLAMDFTLAYLEAFELESTKEMATFAKQYQLPPEFKGLTACAGIAYTKATFPYDRAHALAENLCGYAKQVVKRQCTLNQHDRKDQSALCFHRVTGSLVSNDSKILEQELTLKVSEPDKVDKVYHRGLGVYTINETDAKKLQLPNVQDLIQLYSLFCQPAVKRGPIRAFESILQDSIVELERRYKRWCNSLKKEHESIFNDFIHLMHALQTNSSKAEYACEHSPFFQIDCKVEHEQPSKKLYKTPLGDIGTLISVKQKEKK